MTQIEQRKQQADMLKQEVCRLLEWDELQYGEFQYKIGCQYLQHFISIDPVAIDTLTRNKLYWNWWKNQWHDRDFGYLTNPWLYHPDVPVEDKLCIYRFYHDAEVLSLEISPNGIILGSAYSKMIGDLIKTEVL